MSNSNEYNEDLTKELEYFNNLIATGNIEEADKILKDIIEKTPSSPDLANFQGEFKYQIGKKKRQDIFF